MKKRERVLAEAGQEQRIDSPFQIVRLLEGDGLRVWSSGFRFHAPEHVKGDSVSWTRSNMVGAGNHVVLRGVAFVLA